MLHPPVQPPARKPARRQPVLTTDRRLVGDVLKSLVVAQEVYAADHDGAYTTRIAALGAEGFAPDPRVTVRALRAGRGGYCVSAAGAGRLVLYYDSATGRPSRTRCA